MEREGKMEKRKNKKRKEKNSIWRNIDLCYTIVTTCTYIKQYLAVYKP